MPPCRQIRSQQCEGALTIGRHAYGQARLAGSRFGSRRGSPARSRIDGCALQSWKRVLLIGRPEGSDPILSTGARLATAFPGCTLPPSAAPHAVEPDTRSSATDGGGGDRRRFTSPVLSG